MLTALVLRYLRPYRRPVAAVVTLQSITTLAALYLPTLNAAIIDDGVTVGNTAVIVRLGAVMLAISGLAVACSVGAVFFGSRAAMGFGRDLRAAVFDRVTEFSLAETTRLGPATLLTRTTNDVGQIQALAQMTFTTLATAPIMCVGGIAMAIHQDAGLAWILLVSVPVLAFSNGAVVIRLLPVFRRMQTLIDGINRVLREQLAGIRVIRAFGRESFEQDRFGAANAELRDTATAAGARQALLLPIATLTINISSVALIWFGGKRIDAGAMAVGSLVAFLSYFLLILMAVLMTTMFLTALPRAAACAERVTEVLDTVPAVSEPPDPRVPAGPVTGVLECTDVGFGYPGAEEPVLAGVSFTALPGTTTAIVGGTGSGKSTLVALLSRLYDADAGGVRLDGIDVRDWPTDCLWAALGVVPQRGYLFSGTVADNLRYGRPDATEEQMWAALRIACAEEFVAADPDGLAMPVAQGGANFSGGQRQRLAIARAVIRRPAVYLFDDAFSALDVHTDAAVRARLREAAADATVVIVAQRISTVVEADRIVVLQDGRVVGLGRHEQLLDDCPAYRSLADSQDPAVAR
ncbi:MAG: ABC transporter ATP-binding protein [Mycolicibacterium sp.]|nr:ABC transporter ATP-binding protein [Mycolicibacterium sp.]